MDAPALVASILRCIAVGNAPCLAGSRSGGTCSHAAPPRAAGPPTERLPKQAHSRTRICPPPPEVKGVLRPGADGEGFVQAFRRAECLYFGLQVRPRGLDRDATYEVRDVDRPGTVEMTGRHLMERGLPVEVLDQPGAALIVYEARRQG